MAHCRSPQKAVECCVVGALLVDLIRHATAGSGETELDTSSHFGNTRSKCIKQYSELGTPDLSTPELDTTCRGTWEGSESYDDDAPLLLSLRSTFYFSQNKNELKKTSTYEHRFYYMVHKIADDWATDRAHRTDTYQRPTT